MISAHLDFKRKTYVRGASNLTVFVLWVAFAKVTVDRKKCRYTRERVDDVFSFWSFPTGTNIFLEGKRKTLRGAERRLSTSTNNGRLDD